MSSRLLTLLAGGRWTPANLSGLAARYISGPSYQFTDASPGTTPIVNDGDTVQVWRDATASAYHLTQTVAGSRPVANLTGSTWRSTGDGAAKVISKTSGASIANAAGMSVAIAFLPTTSTGTARYLFRLRSAASGDVMNVIKSGTNKARGEFRTSTGMEFVDSAASITTATPCCMIWSATSALAYIHRLNGVELTGTLAGTFSSLTAVELNALSNTANFFDGSIYEVIVRTSPMTAADITNIETYFRTTYGTP